MNLTNILLFVGLGDVSLMGRVGGLYQGVQVLMYCRCACLHRAKPAERAALRIEPGPDMTPAPRWYGGFLVGLEACSACCYLACRDMPCAAGCSCSCPSPCFIAYT